MECGLDLAWIGSLLGEVVVARMEGVRDGASLVRDRSEFSSGGVEIADMGDSGFGNGRSNGPDKLERKSGRKLGHRKAPVAEADVAEGRVRRCAGTLEELVDFYAVAG